MKVRRFTATTMPEALRQVKAALGPEAVLLETQTAPGAVTVTAAVDDDDVVAVPAEHELAREVRALIEAVRGVVPAQASASATAGVAARLARHGVDADATAALCGAIEARLGVSPSLQGAVAATLARLHAPDPSGRVRVLFGPPGDGKTTTLVKLAARVRREGRRALLVHADGFRVGGAAELTAYGRVLGVPVVSAVEPGALARVVAQADGHDTVLVDTPGAGPGQKDELAELARLAEEAGPEAVRVLVVSAAAGASSAAAAMRALHVLRPATCVLTKCDADSGAAWLGLLWQRAVPVAYLGTGRRIPDDLEAATADGLARRLLAA